MNKKLIASVAAACVLSTGSVFAASNPFADVPAKHWSYGAVQSLSQAGLELAVNSHMDLYDAL